MDEFGASRSRDGEISTAMQRMKESLTCKICLELFNEPVTLRCGDKFCRQCIMRVADNESPCCPLCGKTIHKESIPNEGNELLQASVRNFENLVEAMKADSNIDVLRPQIGTKDSKESVHDRNKPSTSAVQCTPSTSKGSSSTANQSSLEPDIPNPVVSGPSRGSRKNSLHKYLANKSDPESDHGVHSQIKVKRWVPICPAEENDSDAVRRSKKLEGSLSTNENYPRKILKVVLEDCVRRPIDSTRQFPEPLIAICNMNASQIKDVIVEEHSTSVSKTSGEIRISTNLRNKSSLNFNQLSQQRGESSSGQESSNSEQSNCKNEDTTAIDLQNPRPKWSKLSLNKSRGSCGSKDSSPAGTAEEIEEKAKDTTHNSAPVGPRSSSVPEPLQNRTNTVLQNLSPITSSSGDNSVGKRSSPVTRGRRISPTKLGSVFKAKRNVRFLYLGKNR